MWETQYSYAVSKSSKLFKNSFYLIKSILKSVNSALLLNWTNMRAATRKISLSISYYLILFCTRRFIFDKTVSSFTVLGFQQYKMLLVLDALLCIAIYRYHFSLSKSILFFIITFQAILCQSTSHITHKEYNILYGNKKCRQ